MGSLIIQDATCTCQYVAPVEGVGCQQAYHGILTGDSLAIHGILTGLTSHTEDSDRPN